MAQDVRVEHETAVDTLESALTPEQVAEIAARAGLDKKAEDVVVLKVSELSSYADYLVLMTATSDRQVSAVADAVNDTLRKVGQRPIGVEGETGGNWVLIDTGDVVVHVFLSEARAFYDLDGLWADAERREFASDAEPRSSTGNGTVAS